MMENIFENTLNKNVINLFGSHIWLFWAENPWKSKKITKNIIAELCTLDKLDRVSYNIVYAYGYYPIFS